MPCTRIYSTSIRHSIILFCHQATFQVLFPILIWTQPRNIRDILTSTNSRWRACSCQKYSINIKSTFLYSKLLQSQHAPLKPCWMVTSFPHTYFHRLTLSSLYVLLNHGANHPEKRILIICKNSGTKLFWLLWWKNFLSQEISRGCYCNTTKLKVPKTCQNNEVYYKQYSFCHIPTVCYFLMKPLLFIQI